MGSAGEDRPVGLTRDAGWEIGVRRTLPVAAEDAWRLLTSPDGLRAWLGGAAADALTPGAAFVLADGTACEVRVFRPGSHLRVACKPEGWERPSLIQARILPNGGKTVIAFHHEHLRDEADRESQRAHFSAALDQLAAMAADSSSPAEP